MKKPTSKQEWLMFALMGMGLIFSVTAALGKTTLNSGTFWGGACFGALIIGTVTAMVKATFCRHTDDERSPESGE